MKPIGTITACFPYVDEETSSILRTVMDEAKDYNDFAERFCDKSISESLPDLAIYFAYYHCFNQEKYNCLKRLNDANVKTELTKIFSLLAAQRAGEGIEWSEYQKAMFSALKHVENDWMACHIYIAWRVMIEHFHLPEAAVDNETLNMLTLKIENDEEYGFFLSQIHRITAIRLFTEGNLKEAIKYSDMAISQSKKYDDQEALCMLLHQKANLVKQFNFNEALSILEIMKEIVDELRCLSCKAHYLHELGHIAMAKGEFEKAIDYQNQCLANRLDQGFPVGVIRCLIASIYNQKGDGKMALKYIHESRNDYGGIVPFCQIHGTWAYLLLDKIDEARRCLEKAHASSLKSGDETFLAYIHFLEGLLAKKEGDLSSAIFSFRNALEVYERCQAITYTNFVLLEIVDSEIDLISPKKASAELEVSGPWMRKLLDHIEEKDLPGTTAQARLLLAKFRFKQGRVKESKKLVEQVLDISEKTGMHYLKNKAELLVPDLLLS
ncbi:MAG: tetratricopeptide repeat protein [Promethearchaeota archaeon]